MTTRHINTRDKYPCPQRDSNPRSQQPSCCRPRGHRVQHRLTWQTVNNSFCMFANAAPFNRKVRNGSSRDAKLVGRELAVCVMCSASLFVFNLSQTYLSILGKLHFTKSGLSLSLSVRLQWMLVTLVVRCERVPCAFTPRQGNLKCLKLLWLVIQLLWGRLRYCAT
jgi:hypothetical protein